MNWFATVIFAILEVALRAKAHAYRFVGNSRQIGSTLVGLGKLATSRTRPCLAVALSIVLIVCLTFMVTTVSAAPADPGHPASSISAGTFESGNFTFQDNLTIIDYMIVDTDTLYVDALNNRVGIGTSSPATNLNVKGTLNTALTGTLNISDFSDVANTSDDLTSEISVGDAIKIVNASDSSVYEIFTVNAVTSDNLTLDSTPSDNWTEALGYKDSDLFRIDDGDGTGKLIVDKTGYVGIGTTSPTYKLDIRDATNPVMSIIDTTNNAAFFGEAIDEGAIAGELGGSYPFYLWAGGGARMTILTSGNVGIGTTGPNYLLEVAEGTEDAVNLSGVLYVNDTADGVGIGTTDPQEELDVVGDVNATGDINASGDICIYGGKCMSNTGTGDGDVTDVLPGYGIAVDNSGGPSPTVNLSSSSAGAGLNYTAGVLAVGDGEGAIVADGSIGFDCSEVTDSASDGMRCSSEDIVAGAGDGLTANNTDLEINEGEGVGILSDILHFDCSEVTDTANDGVTCSTEDLVVGAGNGLTANATGLEIDLYTGSGLEVDATGLSMNRSCSNGQVLKWVSSGSFWNCTEDSGLGSESDTFDSVADRGATTDQNVTIDSDSDGLTNIADTLYVNGSVDRVGIGTASPDYELQVYESAANARLALTSGTSNNAVINFGDTSDDNKGQIVYNNTDNWMYFRTNNGERIRIDSSGNVGIRTTGPLADLDIKSDSAGGDMLRLSHSGSPTAAGIIMRLSNDETVFLIEREYGDTIYDGISMIRETGNVGIGTTSPSALLDVNGTLGSVEIISAGNRINFTRNDWNYINAGGGASSELHIGVNGNNHLSIDSTGYVGIGTTSPSGLLSLSSAAPSIVTNETDWGTANERVFRLGHYTGMVRFEGRNDDNSGMGAAGSIMVMNLSNGDVGVGDSDPDSRLEVLDTSGPQFRITHTEDTDYGDFDVDSDGNLTISSSSGNVFIELG